MVNKKLEELKEAQRQKIRELGQNRLIKSLENVAKEVQVQR